MSSILQHFRRLPRLATRTASTSTHSTTKTCNTPAPPATKVDVSHVKDKLVEILETNGPISRRRLYDDHISRLFPAEPFTPNEPPRQLWLRDNPEPPPVYLTMSKFKKEVLGVLARQRTIGVVTVTKVRRALDMLQLDEPLRKKIEEAIASEPADAHVCVAGNWWRDFQAKTAHLVATQMAVHAKSKKPKRQPSQRMW